MKRPHLVKALLLATTILGTPSLAQADPVSLTAAFTLAATAVSALSGSFLLGTLLAAAITLGGSLLVRALFGQQLTVAQAQLRTRKFDVHPPFRFAFGSFPQEGTVIFHYVFGPEYYVVYLLNSIPSESVDRIEVNDGIELEFDDFANDSLEFDNSVNDDGAGSQGPGSTWNRDYVSVWMGYGEQTAPPDEWQLADGVEEILDATDAWTGSTVAFVRFAYGSSKTAQARFGSGVPPLLRFYGKWSKLYDPRKDSTSGVIGASGSHRIDDRTTWEYSANPALAALMLATHEYALGFDKEMIPIQQYADAADVCEEESGGVSTLTLQATDFPENTGSTINAIVPDTSLGWRNYRVAGRWDLLRGTGQISAADFAGWAGQNSLKLFSSDTGGSVDETETAQAGTYFDMRAASRDPDGRYLLSLDDIEVAGVNNQAKYRIRVYQAERYKRWWATDVWTQGSSGQIANAMPPDARNVTLVYDSGLKTITTGGSFESSWYVTGDYISIVLEGGEPNESDTEWKEFSISTTAVSSGTDYATGGSFIAPRYRCDGIVAIDNRELDLMEPVLMTMAGHLDTTEGMLGIRAGSWVAPTDTLSEPIGDEITVNGARDGGFDAVRAKFISKAQDYRETDGEGYTLRTGSREFPLQLPMVREPEQAARLEKVYALRAEPNRVITATFDGREATRRIGERVNFALPGFARAAGTFSIDSKRLEASEDSEGFKLETVLTLVEDKAAHYAWTSADYTDQGAYQVPDQDIATIEAPASVVLSRADFYDGTTAIPRAKITITLSSNNYELVEQIEIQLDDGGGFAALSVISANDGDDTASQVFTAYFYPLLSGLTYTARARAISETLGTSDYTTSNSIIGSAAVLDFDHADFGPEYA